MNKSSRPSFFKKNMLLPATFAVLSASAVWLHLEMNSREPLILGFLAAAFFFFRHCYHIQSRPLWISGAILGILLALCYTLARPDLMEDRGSYLMWQGLHFVGLSLLFTHGFVWLFSALKGKSLLEKTPHDVSRKKLLTVFAGSAFLLYLCFLFWILYNYPAEYTHDSDVQLQQILGLLPLSNHHPVAHTALMGLWIRMGLALSGGDLSFAIAFYCGFQALVMALIFAFLVETLYQYQIKRWVVASVLAVFILLPYHGSFSATLWKDVLFGGLVLLLCTTVWRLMQRCTGEEKPAVWELVLLMLSSVGMCLFRSNGLYAFALFVPFLALYFFRKSPLTSILPVCSLVLALVVKGPVYARLDIVQPDPIESLSIPAQHIAAVIKEGGRITPEQYRLIDQVVPVSAVAEHYHPNNSDYIKNLVREQGDQAYIAAHKGELLRLWLELGLANPGIYLGAQVEQTKGYWYPDVDYWYVIFHTDGMELSSDLSLYKDCKLPPVLEKLVFSLLFYLPLLPFAALVLSIGLAVWVCLTLFVLCIVKGQKRELLLFIPVLAVWGTLLIATPVFAEFRYAYCLFTTLPLLGVLPFTAQNEDRPSLP